MNADSGPADGRENADETTIDCPAPSPDNTVIGPYRLTRQLGEGGMGVVYLAQQLRPIRRDVALKIIKPGMDSKQVIARFESERQALALMDHVNISRVFDAGTTASGLPYFVMELVDGLPITQYCDSKRLTVRERIAIFIPVCKAIQHAHQKGIIHRDIKPSNLLVTEQDGKPVAKVIDFGLAKALGHGLSDASMMTNLGTVIGTLQYMSPEQAELSRQDVDTRSDIYSLGVVLYELLTGATPLDHERGTKAAYLEVLISIREEEPPAPSDRMRQSSPSAEIAAQRRTDPVHLSKLLHGELDWITMKALEKDRARRFETVNGLARDLQRYLDGQPVESAPPSVAYRLRKFVRRNRVWLAAATTAVAAICISAGVAISQARSAQQRFNDVRRLANTFLFDFEKEIRDVPGTVKAREMIVSTALDYLNRLSASSSRDPGLQWELATAYDKVAAVQGSTVDASLRRPQDAIHSEEKAIDLARSLDDRHLLDLKQRGEFMRILLHGAIMDRDMKRYDAAKALASEAAARSKDFSPDWHLAAMGDLGMIIGAAGDLPGSTAAVEQLVPIARTNLERAPSALHRRHMAQALNTLGEAYAESGRLEEAMKASNEALVMFRAAMAEAPGNPAAIRDTFYTLNNLGRIEGAVDRPNLGKPLEGAAYFEQSIGLIEPLLAKDPNDRAAKNDIGEMEQRLASTLMNVAPNRSLPHARRAAILLDAASPDKLEDRAAPRITIAISYLTLRQLAEAERSLNEVDQILKPNGGDIDALRNMAWARLESAQGHRKAAEQWFQRAIALQEESLKKAPIPSNACPLATTLDYAANSLPESAAMYRARIAAVWSDQNQRFPHSSYIERQLAEAQAKLAHSAAKF
jgi:serine/threonine protein kinase/tetratricopeptide (TPR) repeat protein